MSAPDGADAPPVANIGPNAAIQLIVALRRLDETAALTRLFADAGRSEWLENPPRSMIAAEDAAKLHVGLRRLLPRARAEAALAEAGRLTADYLLANRIPRFAQRMLKLLPARISASLLMRAISAHAWTFAGGGRFEGRVHGDAVAQIHRNPLCVGLVSSSPACVWHAAVLERLFQTLVSSRTRVTEDSCCARGDRRCRFRLSWRPPEPIAARQATASHKLSGV